jgi:1-acyl-sn-glycerol-3-phosphate acyltransferase
MWRLYLTNFWLLLMTILALPFLLIRFRHGNNTSFLMYVYAWLAQYTSGIRVKILGRENILPQPAVYVFNHQSSLDGIPLGMLRVPRLVIIGKKEIVYVPFIGWTFYLAGNVLIHRGDARKARGQLDAGIHAIKQRKVSIAIFPEGARNRDSVGFLPFKRGGFQMAIDAQVPVVPVVIQSFKHVYDKKAGKMQPGTVQVKVLPAVSTAGLNHKDAQKLAENVQVQMEAEFDVLK